jgi:hypothetical protein
MCLKLLMLLYNNLVKPDSKQKEAHYANTC